MPGLVSRWFWFFQNVVTQLNFNLSIMLKTILNSIYWPLTFHVNISG